MDAIRTFPGSRCGPPVPACAPARMAGDADGFPGDALAAASATLDLLALGCHG